MLLDDREPRPSASDSPPAEGAQAPARQPTLTGPGAKADNRHKFARTMLGLAPLPPADSTPPDQPTPPTDGGQVEEAPPDPAAPIPERSKSKNKTMLGLAFNLPEPASTTPPAQPMSATNAAGTQTDPGESKPESDEQVPERLPSKNKTMLGLAFSLPQTEPKNEATRTLVGTGESAPSTPPPDPLPLKEAAKETLIGVAVPGIAPINPGVAKAPAQELPSASVGERKSASENPSAPVASHPAPPRTPNRALLWALAGVAIALALVSIASVLRWRAVPKLAAKVESDETGRDALLIECSNCDDGTVFSVADAKGEMRNRHVRIPLSSPLKIGDNEIRVAVARGSSRPEIIQMRVPVEFRVTVDTHAIDETPAKLRLRIEKTPPVQFAVEHKPVVFDAAGKGVFELDISNELTSPSPVEGVLEKRISHQVQGPGGTQESALLLRVAATPLVVTSPGSVLITEGQDLKICGRTDPRARVEIAGLQTKIEGDGQFCNAAVIREFGQFEVWISAKRLAAAPRKVKLSIERTGNLREYAKTLYPRVRHEIQPQQGAAPSASGLVALTGVVVEQSKQADSTRYLLKYDAADGTRFARVNSFSASTAKSGAHITVFGEPLGTLDGPDGRKMEELNAAFFVPALR